MKQVITLCLALILCPFLRASDLPAPMPEFMNQQQLAKWKADQAAEAKADAAAQDAPTQFYTGKPYDAEAGGYIFKYRTYNPEMARWTTADPRGFPDGVNNQFYAPLPITQIDPTGTTTVNNSGVPTTGTSGVLSITPTGPATYTNDTSGIQGFFGVNYSVTGLTGSNASLVGDTLESNGTLENSSGASVSYYGFVVQNIQISYSVANANGTNADNTLYKTNPTQYPTNFYEAWLVGPNGTVYCINQLGGGNLYTSTSTGSLDTFISPLFSPDTHGYYNVTGTVNVYSQSAVGTTGPATWGTTLGAGENPTTTNEPGWWSGTNYNHDMQMSWSE